MGMDKEVSKVLDEVETRQHPLDPTAMADMQARLVKTVKVRVGTSVPARIRPSDPAHGDVCKAEAEGCITPPL